MAKILVVDDANFIRERLATILKELGHNVIGEADNGKSAIATYIQLKPDIILLDITMPTVNGVDALRQILKLDPLAKVVICSAVGDDATIEQCMSEGAKKYVLKPFNKDKINAAIYEAMTGKVLEEES